MQPTCIYCGKDTNLNTQLGLSLVDGSKVVVDICDEHAEDASVKTARAKYTEKQDKIKAFLEQAKALGIEIQAPSIAGGLTIARQQPTQQPIVQSIAKPSTDDSVPLIIGQEEQEEGWVSASKIDAADRKGMRSVGGTTQLGGVQSHSSHIVGGQKDILPDNVRQGKVKMAVTEGRAGTQITVPQKRVDGTGTTRIRIVKKENDDTLQRRFKSMANDSRQDRQPDFRNGYEETSRICPICRGSCVANGKECPKCDGIGSININ